MLRAEIQSLIAAAIARLVQAGDLPGAVREVAVEVQDAKSPEHGDFSTNIAMAAAKAAGLPPRAIAEKLVAALSGESVIDNVEVAGPGFVNLRLKSSAIAKHVPLILELNERLPSGQLQMAAGQRKLRINVEFVSVNPNGPITVGSGRGAAFGDTLCRVLEAAGHKVHREYYLNDGVNSEQMRLFAESVRAYIEGSQVPENGYRGEYVRLLAEEVRRMTGPNASASEKTTFWDIPQDSVAITDGMAYIMLLHATQQNAKQIKIGTKEDRCVIELIDASGQSQEAGSMPSDEGMEFLRSISIGTGGGPAQAATAGTRAVSVAIEGIVRHITVNDEHLRSKKFITIDLVRPDVRELVDIRETSQRLMLEKQRQDLSLFGVLFDTWFSEQSLHDSGDVQRRLDELKAKGAADEEPHRIKLKLGKGGKIEEALREEQPVEEDDAELSAHPSPAGGGRSVSAANSGGGGGVRDVLWLRSTKFGDDMDRVLRRKDGRLTYIASDVAYHADKFNRPPNADKLITVLGPDHHGYIGRLHAVVAALLEEFNPGHAGGEATNGLTWEEAVIYRSKEERDACLRALEEARKRLEVIIFQIVRFMKDGKPAPMRKRDGNIYELRDLILELGQAQAPNASQEEQERIGADVARFFYLMRSHDTHMDFDIDLATKQSDENPVFYVQYAHARICSVLRKAEEGGFTEKGFDPGLLSHPRELALIKKILDLPDEVRRAAQDYGVHRLTTYAVELARAFHYFYDACRIIQPDQPELSRARLALAQAARIGLRSTLGLLGVSAPERMERASLE